MLMLVPARRSTPELMDAPGLPEDEVAEAYRVLQRINRQLGNRSCLIRELDRLIKGFPAGEACSVVDVGAGSGDLARSLLDRLKQKGIVGRAIAVDRDQVALRLAQANGVEALQVDALRLPFADRCIDLVTAVKFAHHLEGAALSRMVAEMARVARRRVVILDIRRHWLAYWGFVAWSRVGTRNRLVRYDGPVSVLRGFTDKELVELARPLNDFHWTVRRYMPYQLALVGQRVSG